MSQGSIKSKFVQLQEALEDIDAKLNALADEIDAWGESQAEDTTDTEEAEAVREHYESIAGELRDGLEELERIKEDVSRLEHSALR